MPIPGVGGIDVSRTGAAVRGLAEPRGLPASLTPRVLFDTAVTSEAAAGLSALFGPTWLHLEPDDVPVRLHGVRLPSLTLAYLDVAAKLTVETPCLPGHQLVLTPTTGRAQVTTRCDTVEITPIHAACPTPGEPLRLTRRTGGPIMIVAIEQDTLRRSADALLGRSLGETITFDLVMDLARDGADRWQTALQLLHAEVARAAGPLDQAVDLVPLESFLVATLLLGHGSSSHEALHHATAVRHSEVLRSVVQHIDDHLDEPLAVSDLAAVADVSVRTLQVQFRESFDQTPTQYVRDRRLDRVRDELQRASTTGRASVTDIALRWGFHHEGRFAAAYRQRFGERPSTTLSR